MSSILENLMATQIRQAGLPKPQREFVAIPGRRYRWDFAWTDQKLLLEINGSTFCVGGHSTGVGLDRDYEKSSLAAVHGWFTMSFSGKQVKSGLALKLLQQFFEVHG